MCNLYASLTSQTGIGYQIINRITRRVVFTRTGYRTRDEATGAALHMCNTHRRFSRPIYVYRLIEV